MTILKIPSKSDGLKTDLVLSVGSRLVNYNNRLEILVGIFYMCGCKT